MPPPAVPHGMCLKVIDNRNMRGGMGSETNPLKFMNQDYNILQEYCLKKGRRFEDEFFPPDPRSIGEGLLKPEDMARVEWMRPTKLCPDAAEFIVESVSRFDYSQGIVGNCWFLASVGALTFQSKFLQKVMPDGQSFSHNYTGLFHFRFWRFGNWYDVVIDDYLPTIDRQLIFVQSKTFNEFWPALMEKAYAKVCGSYADMHAGRVSEALMDFTGGVHIHYNLKTAPTDLWEIMYRAFQSEVLMGCETPRGNESEEELPNGIILGHAYTVTNVYQVMSGRYPVKLVRLFNPWGKKEWNGDWSDRSPLWNTVSNEDRKQHLLDDNGEFWMSMEDFLRTFDNIDICCSYPDFLEGKSASRWTSKYHNGSWVIGSTAGGCTNHRDTFCTNPQFWLKVNEMDKACEQGQSNVLVSLIQKPDKRNRRLAAHHGIGFIVFAVPPDMTSEGKLGSSFFFSRYPVARSDKFEAARQVMSFFRLEPGQYVIVPSTFSPNQPGEFILSILCKNEIHIQKDTERTENFLVDLESEPEYNEQMDEALNNKTLFRQYSDQVMSGRYPVKLVRLFNPWGKKEWNGDWSDRSPLWNTVSNEDRKQHLLDDNGEFWMSMEDFLRTFDNIDICCSYPDFLEGKSASRWTSKYHNGSWVIGSTAGGCTNHRDTFCTNPQFWLKVNEMDKACEQGQSNVLVSLIQKPDKRNRRLAAHHGIGFIVFAVPPDMTSEGKLGSSFFFSRYPVARSDKFEAARQVMSFFRLEPGQYVIVPSTFSPNQPGEFILSILCKNEIHIQKDTERTENFLVDLESEPEYNEQMDEALNNKTLFRQYSDQYKVVDAEKLQQILHENLLRGNKNTEGFGLDSCRSIIAMSDFSVSGRLRGTEFLRLWNRILTYKNIFYTMDSSKDGVLSFSELQNAFNKTGMHLNEDILNLMFVRYGGASEQISLEGFICLVMRLNCMASIFQRLCENGKITLTESEWLGLTMYS